MRLRKFIEYSKLLIQILAAVIDVKLIDIYENIAFNLFDHCIYNYPQADNI